jgi:hypothetical protein
MTYEEQSSSPSSSVVKHLICVQRLRGHASLRCQDTARACRRDGSAWRSPHPAVASGMGLAVQRQGPYRLGWRSSAVVGQRWRYPRGDDQRESGEEQHLPCLSRRIVRRFRAQDQVPHPGRQLGHPVPQQGIRQVADRRLPGGSSMGQRRILYHEGGRGPGQRRRVRRDRREGNKKVVGNVNDRQTLIKPGTQRRTGTSTTSSPRATI